MPANDLTYLIMDAVRFVKVYQPSLACRIIQPVAAEVYEKIVDVVKAGGWALACHFDDSHIKMMLRKGRFRRCPRLLPDGLR